MDKTKLKAKNIHLSEGCIERLTIMAVKKGKKFKIFVQEHLEKLSTKDGAR